MIQIQIQIQIQIDKKCFKVNNLYLDSNSIIYDAVRNIDFTKIVESDINTIISLFCNSRDEIDIASFDYIVFSYLGDFIVRYKNQDTANQPIGKSLYLDIQSVRIALIDEYTEKTWNKYYVFFNKGIKYVGGLFVFGFAFRFFYQNFHNVFNGYNNRRMISL